MAGPLVGGLKTGGTMDARKGKMPYDVITL